MHACKPLSVSYTYQSGTSTIGTLVLLFDVPILDLLDIFVLSPFEILMMVWLLFQVLAEVVQLPSNM